MERCRNGALTDRSVPHEQILRYKLEKLEDQLDLYWRQRAKAHWLHKGDRNTKFFQEYASERKRKNKLKKLILEDGNVVEDTAGIKLAITNFYNALFESHAGSRYDELLNQVQSKVALLCTA